MNKRRIRAALLYTLSLMGFLLIIGSAGALERGTIPIWQCVLQSATGFAAMVLCAGLADC